MADRDVRSPNWSFSLFAFLLLAVAGAIAYAVVARVLWGAYPAGVRSAVAGIVIALIVAGLRRFAKR
jgi:hypothetical protein